MCKNKGELNELVAKRRKLSAEKKKIEAQIKDIDHDIIEYVLAARGTTLLSCLVTDIRFPTLP